MPILEFQRKDIAHDIFWTTEWLNGFRPEYLPGLGVNTEGTEFTY